jgi:hypothetical protein
MKRYVIFVAVGIVGLGLVWAGWRANGPSAFAITRERFAAMEGLEKKFCGGWLAKGDLGGTPIVVVETYGGDGSMVMNCTTRADGLFNVTGMGSWKATGHGTVAATVLLFIQDFQGNLLMYEKVNSTMTLCDDEDFMEGSSFIKMYWADQNPLDPEEVPFAAVPVPGVVAQRIAVE